MRFKRDQSFVPKGCPLLDTRSRFNVWCSKVCFRRAAESETFGTGTVDEGSVSNLIVTFEADASAAFCRSSRSTVLDEFNVGTN